MTIETNHTGKIDYKAVAELIADNIELFLDYFGVTYITHHNRVSFPCPIHSSSSPESLNLFTSGNESIGNYVCWTHHCESECGRNSINLIRHMLGEGKSFSDTIKFIESITGTASVRISAENKNCRDFSNFVKTIEPKKVKDYSITREQVRKLLKIPSSYYLNRGFEEKTLRHFDVGFCSTRGKEMFMRTVVPVYTLDGKFYEGCVGRTINEQCPMCQKYHYVNSPCPTNNPKFANKWINSSGFSCGDTLYSIWHAVEHIKKSGKLVIVEGQGDVWRLWEAGIKNAVGLFGCKMTDTQFSMIESLGISDISLALDSDEAGKNGQEKIYNKLKNYYNVTKVNVGSHDIGDMSHLEIQKLCL